MDYEVVNLDEKIAVGIGKRTGNGDPHIIMKGYMRLSPTKSI